MDVVWEKQENVPQPGLGLKSGTRGRLVMKGLYENIRVI
jgi:hypothetical protein